jgi:hypothetical protein
LKSVPIFEDLTLGPDEFIELIENIETIKEDEYWFNKVQKKAASKACRSAVMVGDVLGLKDIKKIVDNLVIL